MVIFCSSLPSRAETVLSSKNIDSFAHLQKIALMPLTSLGSTDALSTSIERIFVGELERLLDSRLIIFKSRDRAPKLRRALETCQGRAECINEVVGGLGFDAFIVGNITGLGNSRVVNLKLIDVRSGETLQRAAEKASGDESELIGYMRKAAVQLVAPEKFLGTLEIVAEQPSIQILVDGALIGTTPLESNKIRVPAGRCALEATGAGLVRFSKIIDIPYDDSVTVSINLPTNDVFVGGQTPYRNRWWTWALVGAGALGVGMGAYFNQLHIDSVHTIESRAATGTLDENSAGLYNDARAEWKRSISFYTAGGLLLSSAGILLVIDLF